MKNIYIKIFCPHQDPSIAVCQYSLLHTHKPVSFRVASTAGKKKVPYGLACASYSSSCKVSSSPSKVDSVLQNIFAQASPINI